MSRIVLRREKKSASAAARGANQPVRRKDRAGIPIQLRGRPGVLAYTQEMHSGDVARSTGVGRDYHASESSTGKRVAIIQRMQNNVVQRCGEKEGSEKNKSGRTTYSKSSDIPKHIRKNKPLHSPNIDKWYSHQRTISIDESGVWTYNDSQGHSVPYPDGYPDFKAAGLVRQEAPIGSFVDRNKDFAQAKKMGYKKSPDSTWHHSEDGRTLQEVDRLTHAKFTHRGGMAKAKSKK